MQSAEHSEGTIELCDSPIQSSTRTAKNPQKKNFGRTMTRPTRPVPAGLSLKKEEEELDEEELDECQIAIFYFARCVRKLRLEISRRTRWWCLKCVIVYLARDIQAYVCNVLRQWRIWLIPTYRVYRLYDINYTKDKQYN